VPVKVHLWLLLTEDGEKDFRARKAKSGLTRAHVRNLRKVLGEKGFEPGDAEVGNLPSTGYNPSRRQYRSASILKMAREKVKELRDWHVKLLVITDADIYDTNLAFVVGKGEVNGRIALVSVSRIRSGEDERFVRRVLKEAMHELGHTMGLRHCRNTNCVMYLSEKLADSDIKNPEYCSKCRTKIGRDLSQRS
jgi:archaemetzincin